MKLQGLEIGRRCGGGCLSHYSPFLLVNSIVNKPAQRENHYWKILTYTCWKIYAEQLHLTAQAIFNMILWFDAWCLSDKSENIFQWWWCRWHWGSNRRMRRGARFSKWKLRKRRQSHLPDCERWFARTGMFTAEKWQMAFPSFAGKTGLKLLACLNREGCLERGLALLLRKMLGLGCLMMPPK